MKSITQFGLALTAAALLIVAGCSGGSSAAPVPAPAPADTTATTSSVAVTTILTTQ